MKQQIVAAMYIALVMVLADFMSKKIYQTGFAMGKLARNKELDLINVRSVKKEVIYPKAWEKENETSVDALDKPA